ncbi:4-coumarate-- ligase [Fusarium albosuccineum]|uniref:4-coumarate-- ligase n=1 Tax=Fusarium albosuccineum TaxID=1237068 RepID=A0A8H4LFH8_9HYPO|nr:4-coumarate-- ligase [Fusarium albosuccineum]
MSADSQPAYAGQPANIPGANVFDFVFSNPFQEESDFTPPKQRVPKIHDDQPIFVDHASDRPLTFSRLKRDALTLGASLQALGLDPNSLETLPPTPSCSGPEIAPVVLVQLPNCLPFATTVLGALAAGLTVTLASPSLTGTELAWVVKNSRPRVLFTTKALLGAVEHALEVQEDEAYRNSVRVFTVDVARDLYPLSPASHSEEGDWKTLLIPSGRPLTSAHPFSPESAATRTAIILWSSGTSGRSKGVLISHQAINFSTASLWHDADFYGFHQRWLGYVPFYHVFGLSNMFFLAIATGSTVFTMPAFKLDTVLAAIPRRQITYLHMAPPVAVMLAKSPVVEPYARRDARGRNAFSSVVAGVTGGAPCGHEIVVQVFARLGFLVRLGYGMSEACSVTVQRGLRENDLHSYKNDTGKPHWGVELMIAAADAGQDETDSTTKAAPFGAPGEILIRSPGLMSAYLPSQGLHSSEKPDMSVTTESLTADGWLRTGDVGTLDPDGTLCITDRIKEMIKVRAYQVAPAELEALLSSSDAVADAGVIGIHDADEATEWPRAYVVAADQSKSEADLRILAQELKSMVESHTARYKWLVGGIVFVKQIPKSPSGKILRRVMRDGGVQGLEVALYQRKKRDSKL